MRSGYKNFRDMSGEILAGGLTPEWVLVLVLALVVLAMASS